MEKKEQESDFFTWREFLGSLFDERYTRGKLLRQAYNYITNTPSNIWEAAQKGNCKAVEQFLDKDPTDLNSYSGFFDSVSFSYETPLEHACTFPNNYEVIQFLLKKGATHKPNALIKAICCDVEGKIIELFMMHNTNPDHGCYVNGDASKHPLEKAPMAGTIYQTPLQVAVRMLNYNAAQVLLAYGADPIKEPVDEGTIFHHISRKESHIHIVELCKTMRSAIITKQEKDLMFTMLLLRRKKESAVSLLPRRVLIYTFEFLPGTARLNKALPYIYQGKTAQAICRERMATSKTNKEKVAFLEASKILAP